MRTIFLPVAVFICILSLQAQQRAVYNPSIDVQHYEFNISVSDANDSLYGRALITVRFMTPAKNVQFDLMSLTDTGTGMIVTGVKENGKSRSFVHRQNVINIPLAQAAIPGQSGTFEISYKGIPADGLIISKNRFSHRTMFADNWPNRARHWIPCKDHLSDKASLDFIVTAPSHYQVVANGVKVEEKNLGGEWHLTHWKEEVPLPTKVMVVGIADFAVEEAGMVNGIPVSSWVFPEQKEKGFYDYAQAVEILPYFIKNIGPYSYKKLANVQSRTIFGGMENAGAIFYYEGSITGTRKSESLLAHEIAHQWFGDAATEADWPHLWLSEGFATEMTHLYLESKYGHDTLVKSMQADRRAVIEFTKKKKVPVVDTSAGTDIMKLLNTNSYQKGGWVLHMLRNELGNDVFWNSVRAYYKEFRGRNAYTEDLQRCFEQNSGRKLDTFFAQWLYTPENPAISLLWSYDDMKKMITARVNQQTNSAFVFPLEIGVVDEDGKMVVKKINISQKQAAFGIESNTRPAQLVLDPNCVLLFEGTVAQQ